LRFNRLALLGLVATALATAGPITITFNGTGSGSLGASTFTGADFTFTFTSDTAALISPPPCCLPDTSTPSGTTAAYSIVGIGSGFFTQDQAVFTNPMELTAGIWHYNDGDWLTIGSGSFDNSFHLASNLGPVSGITSNLGSTFSTTGGTLALTNVSALTFTETVSAVGAVPEPSTLAFLGLGLAGIVAGRLRRKAN
jgi:hypothetical protein